MIFRTSILREGKRPTVFPGLLLIFSAFALALIIYKDYGVIWDEVSQQNIGTINLEFINTLDAGIIDNFWDRDHGASFEIILVWMQQLAGISDTHDIFPFRHVCTFLFYLAGIFCGYLLLLRMYHKQWLAILGMVMLVLQPRIFAHAFFNSKDTPFLAAVLIALYTISVALEGKRISQYALAGAACGFAAGIRLTAGLLIVCVIALLVCKYFIERNDRKRSRTKILLFIGATAATLYLTWPTLWYHPIDNLVGSLKNLSQFGRFDTNVLFQGKMIYCTALPWYYAPFWIGISTPILWLVIGVSGICLLLFHLINKPASLLRGTEGQMLLLCAASFIMPLLMIITMRPVVYDDWRHLYFIYPPFITAGLYGIKYVARSKAARLVVIAACLIQSAITVLDIILLHPFQQVYFNCLVPRRPEYLRAQYDLEYWGASYKQGFEYLLTQVKDDRIPLVKIHTPHFDNCLALPYEARRRIRWTDESEKGAYLMTNFRVHPEDYPYRKVWGIKREGSTIMQIYRVE